MVRGVIGETGGLRRVLSEAGAAPGLNEKSGRAEGPDDKSEGLAAAAGLKVKLGSADCRFGRESASSSSVISKCCTGSSTTDLGRRPAALENEDADEGGRAGNTKGGFGGGMSRREAWELEKCVGEGIDLSKDGGIMMGCVALLGPPIAALSTVLLAA